MDICSCEQQIVKSFSVKIEQKSFQFVTISADADPLTLWNLFTYYWKLFVPHVVATTTGEFPMHDDHWRHISERTWIFTKGSSPVSEYIEETCIIALQQAKSFKNWEILSTPTKKVGEDF